MAKGTVEGLFALIEKSRLLSAEQLEQARQAAEGQKEATAVCAALVRKGLLTRWQANQLLSGRWSFFLGKYRLLELLGRGGMGSVFLGEHVTMNRRVALKVLSKQIGKAPGSLDKFLAEARLIASLDHPNIVHAFSVDCEGDRYYIVMEYVEGTDLQQIVEKEGPMEFERAADCIRQAAEGLAHAHRHKVVHCDIKPSNLLLTEQGQIKILDMGVARLIGAEGEAAKPDDSVLGTVDYLAPEQALASPNFDQRADIYSLGCTFYFLLTGRPPFPEGTLAQRIMKHQTQTPRAIAQLRKNVPEALVAICNSMMMKDPEERCQSADEVARSLSGWLSAVAPKGRPKAKPAPLPPRKAVPVEDDSDPLADIVASAEAARFAPKPASGGRQAPNGAEKVQKVDKLEKAQTPNDAKTPAPVKKGKRGSSRSKGLDKRVAIGLGVGGAVLAVAGIVVVLILNFRKPAEVGQPPAEKTQQVAAVETKPNKEEKVDLPDLFAAPKPKEAAPPEAPPPEAAKPAEDAKNDEPKKDEPNQEEPAKNSPPDLGEKKDDPKPPEPPKPEPPKPAPPKEPPKEPPKAEPFKEVVADVELPKVPKDASGDAPIGDPVPLGTVDLPEGTPLTVELLGGKTAMRGGAQFSMEPRADGEKKAWVIRFESKGSAASPDSEGTAVAEVSLVENKLQFQWLGEAASPKVRPAWLHNCGLKLSAAGASKFVPLNRPTHTDPLVFDLERGIKSQKIALDAVGDPSQLRLQVTAVEGVPKFQFLPDGDTMNVKKGEKAASEGGKGKKADKLGADPKKSEEFEIVFDSIHLVIKCDLQSAAVNVSYGAAYLPPDQPPFLLSGAMGARITEFQAQIKQCEQVLAQQAPPNLSAPMKRTFDERRKLADQTKKNAAEMIKQLTSVEALRQKYLSCIKVKYRIYALCDGEKVDLAVSAEQPADGATFGGKKGSLTDMGDSAGETLPKRGKAK